MDIDPPEKTDDEGQVVLHFDAAKRVNFASAQNDIPVIRSLSVKNETDEAISDVTIKLVTSPEVIRPKSWVIDRIAPDQGIELNDLSTPLDIEKLNGLNETERGTLTLTLQAGETVLQDISQPLDLLAKDQWGGLADMDRLLAAYVLPNDAMVATLLKDASRLLERAGQNGSIEGYQSRDPSRAWMLAGAIWSATTGLGLTYANPPASFEDHGQKIRSPERIKREGLATCLDTSLLLAAAWEQAGLHPVILFTEGHAFVGVWLIDRDFGAVTQPDVVAVRKAIVLKEFVAVETTMLTKRPTIGFAEAADAGRERLSEAREHEFLSAIEICRARSARIRPLASHSTRVTDADATQDTAAPAALPKPLEFGMLPEDVAAPLPTTPRGRIERWQSKLLDLSLRNRLLNFKETKQTVPCRVPNVSQLEDALADQKVFRAYPLLEEDPIGDRQVTPEERNQIINSAIANAYEHGQVTVNLNRTEMNNRLLTLFRKAKSDLQEGGTNTLFLAAGFLRWQREGESRHYRAPLLLIPVKLERKSARSEFRIIHHEDEVRFNSTLLEFLKRDFDLSLPELDGDLPTDESGIDLPRIFAMLRTKVRDVPGFEVVEDISISTFSFSKYLMWKDLVDRTDDLRNNRLVAHLVDNPDKSFDTGQAQAVRPDELDAKFTPKDLVTPLPADSSQLAAVIAAQEGRDFVLIGPPGTGKSQTIANIICQCLAHGKTVLFVAEKAAALDVVQRRLEQYGLGEAVLELHSNKTDRKRVLNQLGRGWDRAASTREDGWHYVNDKLRIERDKLNDYVTALHAKGTQGFSIYDALGWTAAEPKGFALEFANKDAHDAQSFTNLEDIADVLDGTHKETKDIPPMTLITAEDWSFAWQDEILDAARQLRTDTDWMVTAGKTLLSRLGLNANTTLTRETTTTLDQLAKRMEDSAKDLRDVPDLPAQDLETAAGTFGQAVKTFETGRAGLSATYDEQDILRMPLDQMDNDWRMANASIWPKSALKRRSLRKLLQSYAKSGTAAPEGDIPALRRMRDQLNILTDHPVAAMAGSDRSIAQATELAAQATSLRSALSRLQDDISDTVAYGTARAALIARPNDKLADALADWHVAQDTFAQTKTRFETAGGHVPPDMPPTDLMREIDVVLANRDRLNDWTHWRKARAKADAAGLSTLADKLETGDTNAPAKDIFRRAYARWWLPLALDASEPLRRFVHWDHEKAIQAFRDLDDKAADLAPTEVMRRINHQLPTRDGVPRKSELGTLRYQLGLQRPSMPIRTLLGNLKETLPRLAPCVLMSPLSIAQYLPAGQAVFDLVIFDEASQITTWDAVGAIARARQSIVVGDPKQLPPTNFFGRSNDDDEDVDPLMGDMPSILDEVANAGIPTRQLDWHYRSRDEALIAFSNHHYYGDRLVTFPAPSTGSDAVKFHNIKGTYARGSGRINQDEAKAIVAMIAKRLSDWIKLDPNDRPTLGVITFNAQQQGLILDLLDDLRRKRPDLEWFFEEDRIEPVIVKNLENIQGDERDVMLFSITFGPDLAGKLSMAFGALNQDGGEKRLNVAVTRARQELHVFASITADQIDLSRTRALGVRHLKAFLDYAQRGAVALPAADEGSLGPAENPFEDAIAEAFRAKGWDVRTQIGVSGFRIDLGIVNPDRAGAYLAGIECDGATYHSSATARDRDKVRQAVLEGLGWTILRIWSTDWFRDAGSVVARIHTQLEELLAEHRAKIAEEETPVEDVPAALPNPAEPLRLLAEQAATYLPKPEQALDENADDETPAVETPDVLPLFAAGTEADQDVDISPDNFFESSYLPTLRTLVDRTLAQQGPMPFDVLAREISRLHGWQRTGRRINDRVEIAAQDSDESHENGRAFLWQKGTLSDRSPFKGMNDRKIRDVSRTELATLFDQIGRDLESSDDAVLEFAKHIGIARLSSDARDYLTGVLDWYRHQNTSE